MWPTRGDYVAEQDNRCCYCAEQWLTEHGRVFKPITEKGTWTVKQCNLGRFALKYVDPTDDTNPSDKRFESAIADLTADPRMAQAALKQIRAYLVAGSAAALP
jgi:hypothetical protein